MKLYLMRHGDAEQPISGQPDSARSLTSAGRIEVAKTVRRAIAGGLRPDLILSSPYVRATETAQIAAATLAHTKPIVPSNQLVPHSAPEAVWEELRAFDAEDSVLLTSHEPLVGNTVGFLLNSPHIGVPVKTASIIRIDLEQIGRIPSGILRWMITPKIS